MIFRSLQKLDLFGYSVGFKYRGKDERYRTAGGGLLSLLFAGFVASLVYFRVT